MSYCSPKNRGSFTCFDIDALRKMATAYNETKAKSEQDMIVFNKKTSKKQLWNMLRDKLSGYCQTEWCWLDLDFIKSLNDETVNNAVLPKGPAIGWDWLMTSNINASMKQYEEAFPGFVFFGPVPIDFAEIQTELNSLDLPQLYRRGIKSIGIIFNMDPHTQGGSHWVSMYVDLGKGEINFFDSYGLCPPPKEIQTLINSLNKTGKEILGKPMFVNCNTYRHQFKNSECGVYCMYFIVESLKGRSFEDIATNIILDDQINKYRSIFFRP